MSTPMDSLIWDSEFTRWIRYRNPHNLGPVVIQSFMLLCAALVVLGLVYVIVLVIAIAIHHVVYDRDPKRIPDYVKNSVQFKSDSEDGDSDEDGMGSNEAKFESEGEADENLGQGNTYASTAKKLANLDKFMNLDDKK